MVEQGREVNSSHSTCGQACWRIHSELQIADWSLWPWTLAFVATRTIFQIQSQMLSSNFIVSSSEFKFFLTKFFFSVSMAVGWGKYKTTGNSILFRWTSGLRGFITNLQGPARFICFSLPCSPCCVCILSLPILLFCLPSYIRAAASVVPSSADTNWHAQFSTGTFNPKDWAHRKSSFISSPFGNCLCSLQGALGGFLKKDLCTLFHLCYQAASEKNLILPRHKKKENKIQMRTTGVSDYNCIQIKLKWKAVLQITYSLLVLLLIIQR